MSVVAKRLDGLTPLGMEVGLGPDDFVFDGDPATPRKKEYPHPILLWPNGWMDQDATRYYGGKRRLRRCCVRWGRSSPVKEAQPPPHFRFMSIVAERLDG